MPEYTSYIERRFLRAMAAEGSISERWFWLDWLRVLSIGLVFLYHCGMPFVIDSTWHITNPQPDLMISLFNIILSPLMPLLFVVSGISTYFSLSRRSPGQFAWERFKRLMIPFIIVGLFLILPIHVYFDSIFHGTFTGNLQSFYFGPYFTKFFPFDFNFSPTYFADSNQGIYLWYVFWLFVFSLVTVHFFKWLTKQENRDRISRLATITNRLGGIFLLAIPIIIINIISVPPFFVFPSGYGGGKLPTYLAFFVTAYFLATDSQFGESIDKNKVLALLVGVGTTVSIILWIVTFGEDFASTVPQYIVVSVVWPLCGWSWVVAILGFGRRFLSFKHRLLGFSNELVLPFYILHQTIIVAIAFFVVSLNLIPIGKYLIIILASFSMASVLLLPIRQFNVLRFLFGIRSKPRRNLLRG
jgi:heme/copper-type cytochrome/quinol oxidase subunit 2